MNKCICTVSRLVATLVVCFFSTTIHAQRISKSDFNGFTGERNIETSIVSLKQGFSAGLGVAFRAINKNYYVSFIGYGKKETAITKDDKIHFMMKDAKVFKFSSRINLPSNDPDVPNVFIHHYYITLDDVEVFKNSTLSILRIVSSTYDTDLAISRKNARDFSKLSDVFLKEVSKNQLSKFSQ